MRHDHDAAVAAVTVADDALESLARQYDLRQRAVILGWPAHQVVVIDEDLGRSGASAAGRSGFSELVADVGLGKAGNHLQALEQIGSGNAGPADTIMSLQQRTMGHLPVYPLDSARPRRCSGSAGAGLQRPAPARHEVEFRLDSRT